jgi:lipoprotein-anchoring transpeptidase ErfK/SrfK
MAAPWISSATRLLASAGLLLGFVAQGSSQIPAPQGSTLSSNDQAVIALQVALARRALSPGSIDGVMGGKTTAAIRAFQTQNRWPATGHLDEITRAALRLEVPLFTTYAVSENDLVRLRPVGDTWLKKSQQDRLEYETIDELIAEKSQSSPTLVRRLNPQLDWRQVTVGTTAIIANVQLPVETRKAAYARINLEERVLQAFDDQTNLLAHFPCSIAQSVSQRPRGQLQVAVLIPDPNYTFDPNVFVESAEARQLGRKLVIPPGPNNPVGTVWIGLNRPGYGIHGTPRPEQVGRAESHGCFRLANWNAEHLLRLSWLSMPIQVVDTP